MATARKPARTKTGKSRSRPAESKAPKVRDRTPRVRYAVVGLGYFAQVAVLPAFAHAKNSRLTALVSDDPVKLKQLARKYGVEKTYTYAQYQECLASKEVDAVYIALPNDMHKEYAVRAARMGVHVLCEKPMAVTARECEEMIREAKEHEVRLMVAYRLHFESANLLAADLVASGKIGDPRVFQSAFSMQVKHDNIRTRAERAGGPLYDIGVYCINAARYIFRDEPYQAFAFSASRPEERFKEVDEMFTCVLRFPKERLASFTCSFGAADCATYRILGTEGDLAVEPAYEYAFPIKHRLTVKGRTRERTFPKKDQMAGEIVYFSDCVLKGTEPEPSGAEGLADVRIIEALLASARSGHPVPIDRIEKKQRPTARQAIRIPPIRKPELIHAESPTQD
jgi:predicted dehydrogenase